MTEPMHAPSTEDETIMARAAAWLVRRDEGFTEAEAAAFSTWEAADSRHAAAVADLEATSRLLGRLPQLGNPAWLAASRGAVRPVRRRRIAPRVFAAGLGLAAALAVILWVSRPEPYDRTFVTADGGYERVMLPDGSCIELNAGSRVHVRLLPGERQVTLAGGEAHFSVAKDPSRPFVVSAGSVSVRAVGTAFNVRLSAAAVEVLVTEGRVQVARTLAVRAPVPETPLLVAGDRAVIAGDGPAAPRIERIEPAAMREALAWQAPRLVFVETPLAEVVAQFNRRNRVQLELDGPELAARPVGGSFQADQVEVFVRLLESSGDIAVDRLPDGRVRLRRSR